MATAATSTGSGQHDSSPASPPNSCSGPVLQPSTTAVAAAAVAGDGAADGSSTVAMGHGHFFTKKTFHKPSYCHHCTDMLWGLIRQGFVCEVCNFVVHDKCLRTVVSPCSSIASNLVKNPVAHCWTEPGPMKRKFCNLCRKRLEDSLAIRCEICEYYAHLECQDFVVSDCKECAVFIPGSQKNCVPQYHHWREGNLPANSKCLACKKTCWSSECLAGMRCEFCGVTAHSTCYEQLPLDCSFGVLREIYLPPYSITVPDMDVNMETQYRFQKKQSMSVCEDLSSSGDSKTEEEEKRSPKEKDRSEKDKEDEIVRLFDGSTSLKKRQYRSVAVPRNAPAQVLLEAALRTFHISDDPKEYYLTETTETEGNEKEVDLTLPVRGQITSRDGKRASVFLRFRDKDPNTGGVRVYPGKNIWKPIPRNKIAFRMISCNTETTAMQVVETALANFDPSASPDKHKLVEVTIDNGIYERDMEPDELPLHIVKEKTKESLRLSRNTRFYVKSSELDDKEFIAIYVGNLPTGLSQKQYEKILIDIVGKELRWKEFDAIYHEYGALVILYDSIRKARPAYSYLTQSGFDDKSLLVLVLPHLQSYMVPDYVTPLLVLVNVKSGGQQGMELLRSFRKLLNPHQVYDLMNGGPLPGLYVFRNIPYFRIMVCGGDGTVGWALSCLDNVGQDALCNSPPMAIVPLGTGNDLARVLRWGTGYSGTEEPLSLLRDVIDAEEIKLDRWTVIFHPNEKEQDETKVAIANDTNAANTNEDSTSIFVMNNYFGLGLDADLCLDFHNAREENPEKFNSRLHNKGVYLKMGLRKMMNRRSCKDLHRVIRVEMDGKIVDLPPVEGIIVLNILSWASGANPWGPEKEDQFAKPTHYDGMLEIVGVTGVVHMGQIQSGLRSAMRIAQGGHLRIHLLTDLPVQVDGEPWIQPAGQVVVLRSALKATMLKKSKNKIKRRNTEPSIYFPNDPSLQPQSPSADGESCGPL